MNSWSLREQLCLASSVLKSGDQNWMNVSRSVKTIASQNSVERFDWFSQRACAQQYTYLIKNMDITKRKKRESGEAAGECIVRRLTHDRISELSRILKTHRDQYLHLKNEWSLLKNGTISDEKLRKMWCAIEQEESPHKQDVEQELSEDTSCIINSPSREPEHENDRQTTARTHDRNNFESCFDRARALSPSSSESPSPTKDCHISVAESNLFLIPSLPITKMEQGVEQLEMQSSIFVESGPDKHCQSIQTYHRKNVPTLAKLLETSSPEIQKMIYDNSHNSTNQMDGSIVGCTKESKCTELTGTQTCGESSTSFQTTRKHERKTLGSDLNSDSIRGVEAEASTTDKNEINKIVGDIEGSIKKEITDGFSTLATGTASSDASLNSKFHDQITTYSGSLESKNSDDSNLSSDSPSNGMCMGEIDSSTSNIAEIIGTPIDTMKASILVVGQSQEYKMDEQPRIIDEGVFKSSTEVMKDDELQQKPSLVGSFHVFGSTASLDERRSSMIASDRYCDGQIDDCQEIQKVEDLEDSSEEKSAREASERVSTQSRGALNESTTQLSDNQSTYEYDDPSCRSENIECHEKQNEDNAGESRSIMSLSEKNVIVMDLSNMKLPLETSPELVTKCEEQEDSESGGIKTEVEQKDWSNVTPRMLYHEKPEALGAGSRLSGSLPDISSKTDASEDTISLELARAQKAKRRHPTMRQDNSQEKLALAKLQLAEETRRSIEEESSRKRELFELEKKKRECEAGEAALRVLKLKRDTEMVK